MRHLHKRRTMEVFMPSESVPDYVVIPGERIHTHTNTFPSRHYWYRHDRVILGNPGVTLRGHIQVRYRDKTLSTSTCIDGCAVMGRNIDWLVRNNGGLTRGTI